VIVNITLRPKGKAMKKEIPALEYFNKIHFKDFGTLILTQGDQPSLTIEADEELLPELEAEVRKDTLHLGIEDDWISRIGKAVSAIFSNAKYDVVYTLTCKDLEKISISGKCNLECDALAVDHLSLVVSGLGFMQFSHLDCNDLETKISGRGEFTAAGRADHQSIRISGSGEVNTPNLACQSMDIVISGQGNATVRANERLNITISGLGQVNYYGHPKLRQVISGIGKSKRLNDG
jgi:hypothetical protein